jgi:hypothetical protein
LFFTLRNDDAKFYHSHGKRLECRQIQAATALLPGEALPIPLA